jgi:DNA-binding response OmpR family regulator
METARRVVYHGRDARLASLLTRTLEPHRYVVEWRAEPPVSAEELVSDWYRLLVIDSHPTEWDALGFVKSIKAHHAGVPVVMVAANQNAAAQNAAERNADVATAQRLGADAVLLRPVSAKLLLEAAHAAFRRLDHWRGLAQQPERFSGGELSAQATATSTAARTPEVSAWS